MKMINVQTRTMVAAIVSNVKRFKAVYHVKHRDLKLYGAEGEQRGNINQLSTGQ